MTTNQDGPYHMVTREQGLKQGLSEQSRFHSGLSAELNFLGGTNDGN